MGQDSCKEKVNELLSDLGASRVMDKERYETLPEICDLVDEIVKIIEEDGVCEEVLVSGNAEENILVFSIFCDEIVMQRGSTHPIFKLVQMIDSIKFSKARDDVLRIDFYITDLWL